MRLAAKVLASLSDTRVMARFAREAYLSAELRHPNLVPIIDFNFVTEASCTWSWSSSPVTRSPPAVRSRGLASARRR